MENNNEISVSMSAAQTPIPDNNIASDDKDKTLNKLQKLQLLIKKESSLKELCK